MKRAPLLGGLLLWLAANCAEAHAHLQQSSPADGSVLNAAPAQLVLHFSEAARLTGLWIESGGARQAVGSLPDTAQATIVVPLPPLTPGSYVVSFRALGADGHVVPGEIRFTFNR
ncbi:MAG TPA: copper resistance CopC family protein [Steroidobacteraceae bacterium]|nr:copper resistance CopC family protein [Steroidobacteraceae bacterium]